MANISVQFNKISVGSQDLDIQEILPCHKKIINSSLTKIFKEKTGDCNQTVPFQVQFKPGRVALCLPDREMDLGDGAELKSIQRIVKYYQHVGSLPREGERDLDTTTRTNREVQKSVQAMNDASIPGANGTLLAGLRITDQSLSLIRNILFAIPSIGPKDPIVGHLGYYSGIFWTFFSFREFDDGILEYRRSKLIKDGEGRRRAEARILSGGLVSAGSLGYLGGKFCESLSVSGPASAALGVSNVLFGVGSLLAVGTSLLGAVRCERFNHRLNEYLENPKLTEVQKMQGALRFLKDTICVTVEEMSHIEEQINRKHPHLSSEKKEQLIQQKLADFSEAKVKYLKRRTSNKSLRLILNHADELLGKLSNKDTCIEGIKECTVFFNSIRQENRIKLSLYMLGLVASILSFVGMLIMSFTSATILPFVLFGIAGTIYLAISIYTIGGMFIKNDGSLPKKELYPT